jgi:hypothetical protein
MRFLKTLTLNRRAIYDSRVALDIDNNFTLANSFTMVLPKSDASVSNPTVGQLRYNTSTNEVEVYQGIGGGATWRSLRFKESIGIIQQDIGTGDAIEEVFGPLVPNPVDSTIDENTAWASNGNVLTPGDEWTGANIIVLVENVFQLYNTNYTIVLGENLVPTRITGERYVQFSSPVDVGKHVTVLHGFDR